MVAVDHPGERPEARVLGEPRRRARHHGRHRHQRPHQRVGRAEDRAVRKMHCKARGLPPGPARDELAEYLHVVIAGPEDALVERLLGRPDGRGGRSGHRSVPNASQLHVAASVTPRSEAGSRTAMSEERKSGPLRPRPLGVYHERTRQRGVNPFVYWPVRLVVKSLILAYFRLRRLGRGHIPQGGVILAANHRSFLDPFAVGCCLPRPVYFVAKRELFRNPILGWFLNCMGAFPIRRGESDEESMETALRLLDRGDPVVIFPEGTRIPTGSLGKPKRGVGRLALESGAPVVPIAVAGSERARDGWKIKPVKVHVRFGPPLTFPRVEQPSPFLAGEVTERIWPCVGLQWEWLGGLPPPRPPPLGGGGPICTPTGG